MTLTPIVECSAVDLSLIVFTTWVCHGWDSNTQPPTCGTNHCPTAVVVFSEDLYCLAEDSHAYLSNSSF